MNSITRRLAVAALVAAILVPATADDSRGDSGRTEYMPCAIGDDGDASRNCVWDARHQGNGTGQSFFVGRDGRMYPLPHHIAHYLIYGGTR